MPSLSWTNVFTNQDLTKKDFITNFRTRIDEDASDIISDVQITELIRQGLRDINFRTKLLPEYATVSLDGSSSYTLPADMSELEEIFYIDAETPANYTIIESNNLLQIQEDGYSRDTIKYYVRNGQSIELFGANIATGTLRAYGCRIPTCPNDPSGYIDLPPQYIELLYMWCEWKYFSRLRKPDEETVKRDLYLTMSNQVAGQVKEQYSRGVTAYG